MQMAVNRSTHMIVKITDSLKKTERTYEISDWIVVAVFSAAAVGVLFCIF